MNNLPQLLIVMAIVLVASVPLVLGARWLSLKLGMVSTENTRTSHEGSIPDVGGWCFLVFGICYSIYDISWLIVTIPMALLCILGMIDDKRNLSPWIKLIVELIVTFAAVSNLFYYLNMRDPGWWISFGLTWFVAVAIINAINLIDGIDGLAIGIVIMILLLEIASEFIVERYTSRFLPMLPLLMVLFAFNVWGKRRKVFLGDGGSLALGMIVAWAIFERYFHDVAWGLYLNMPDLPDMGQCVYDIITIAVCCLLIIPLPLIDMARVAIVRICHKESPFHADRRHFHHILIDKGLTHLQAALIEIGINSLPVIIALILVVCGVLQYNDIIFLED